MKIAAIALAGVLGFTASAQAVTYSTTIEATTFTGFPGLQTVANNLPGFGPQLFASTPFTFDLVNLGDSATTDAFSLVIFQTSFAADDFTAQPITVSFDFGSFGTVDVTGTTVADAGANAGFADFDVAQLRVSPTEAIEISITDTFYGTSGGVITPGAPGRGIPTLTFTLVPVPVPAALPLFLSAMALFGFLGYRRRETAAA